MGNTISDTEKKDVIVVASLKDAIEILAKNLDYLRSISREKMIESHKFQFKDYNSNKAK